MAACVVFQQIVYNSLGLYNRSGKNVLCVFLCMLWLGVFFPLSEDPRLHRMPSASMLIAACLPASVLSALLKYSLLL